MICVDSRMNNENKSSLIESVFFIGLWPPIVSSSTEEWVRLKALVPQTVQGRE
jgi:hypothetical protein